MELVAKLRQRETDGDPVKVGVVGCGQMGSGLCNTINSIAGMAVKAVADIRTELAVRTFRELGLTRDDIVISDKKSQAEDAIRDNKVVVTEDAMLLTELDGLDVNASGVHRSTSTCTRSGSYRGAGPGRT